MGETAPQKTEWFFEDKERAMKRIVLLGLVAVAGLLSAGAPAMADGFHHHRGPGIRVGFYGGYGPYAPYYYPPPRVYYYPPYAAYPAYPVYPPAVGGYYRAPGFSFSFGR
jgi:hypothetical protein